MDASSFAADREQRFNEAVAAYLEAVESGKPADREALLLAHADLASDLRAFFAEQDEFGAWAAPVREVIREVGGTPSTLDGAVVTVVEESRGEPAEAVRSFGDYEILAELGRGGMGVVYRARQKSLNRPVALKVIRAAALASPEDRRRFRNEAEIVALLDHPNIVPVHEVGEHDGRLYFSMKLIEGASLAEQLDRFRDDQPAAARLLVAVARAVHHAHQRGVLHRDLKPSNILLDWRAGGVSPLSPPVPHVTDFGLARRLGADSSLTESGALVGTPRYMAPEQAGGGKGLVTTATDVHGLGAVLYALLTGGPPFRAEGVQETLEQVRTCEPRPPSALRRGGDRELETVCLKCLEKEPERRYGSAEELARDLERWLNHEPVRARRTRWWQRLGKWGRRRPAAAALTAVLLVAAVAGGAGGLWWVQRRAEAKADAEAAIREAMQYCLEERWPEGQSAVRRAQAALTTAGADRTLRQQAAELARDLDMAGRLEEARLAATALKADHFDAEAADRAYAEAFRWYGLDPDQADPQEAAQWIQRRPIARQLVAALAHWSEMRCSTGGADWQRLLALAAAADPDDLGRRLRLVGDRHDRAAAEELAAATPPEQLSPALALLVGRALGTAVSPERKAAYLRQAQSLHPDDFWINNELALALEQSRPPRLAEAIHFYTAAVALRPQSPGARLNLGVALADNKQWDEAIAEYRAALRLKEAYADAHNNLGNALTEKGRLDEAILEYRQALDIDDKHANAHKNLGSALAETGRLDEAIAEHRKAVGLRSADPAAHYDLANTLRLKGELAPAIAEYKLAIGLKPDYAEAHNNLGGALLDRGRVAEAIRECRRAVELEPENAQAHNNLAYAFQQQGDLDKAIAGYKEAIRLRRDYAVAHNNLGGALRAKHRLDGAIAEFREAIRFKRDYAEAYRNLGCALHDRGRLDDAITAYGKALRLKDDADTHKALGDALANKHRLDDGIAEYGKAIALRKDNSIFHYNLANLLYDARRFEQAVAQYREAIDLKPDYAEAYNNLGDALMALRRPQEAITAYRHACEVKRDFPEAHNNLGNALLALGLRAAAIAEYRKALQFRPGFAVAHFNLGNALKDEGRLDLAVAEYRRAVRFKEDYLGAYFNLGMVLLNLGRFREAAEQFRLASELAARTQDRPELPAQWLRMAEQWAALDARLPVLLKRDAQPKDAGERLALAQLCQRHKKLYAAAARWYKEAFTAEPGLAGDLKRQHRYNAARAAALAGCGQGEDRPRPDEPQRRAWRKQALEWLRADLAAYAKAVEGGPAQARAAVGERLVHWRQDADLAGVRDAVSLDKLPEPERDGWRRLWKAVERLLARAQATQKKGERADGKGSPAPRPPRVPAPGPVLLEAPLVVDGFSRARHDFGPEGERNTRTLASRPVSGRERAAAAGS
jgi:serine/threonine-protein kinase